MLDSTIKSLEKITFASNGRKRYATQRRHIVDVFATICWFHEIREHLGAGTVVAVQNNVEPHLVGSINAARRWQDYRQGRHSPLPRVIDASEKICPEAVAVYNSILWDALRLDRPVEPVATALLEVLPNRLGRELLARMLDLQTTPIYHPRWPRKRCIEMIRLGSLEGLAALVISMRLAAAQGENRLAREFARFSGHYLIVLGCWFHERGVARSIGEYFEEKLWPACCNPPAVTSFSAQHYITNIHIMKEVWEQAAATNGCKVSSARMMDTVLNFLGI